MSCKGHTGQSYERARSRWAFWSGVDHGHCWVMGPVGSWALLGYGPWLIVSLARYFSGPVLLYREGHLVRNTMVDSQGAAW